MKDLKYTLQNFKFYKSGDEFNSEVHYEKYNKLLENDEIIEENITELNKTFNENKNSYITFKIIEKKVKEEILNELDEIINFRNIFLDLIKKESNCYINLYKSDVKKYVDYNSNDTKIFIFDKEGNLIKAIVGDKILLGTDAKKFYNNHKNDDNTIKMKEDEEMDTCKEEKIFCEIEYNFC